MTHSGIIRRPDCLMTPFHSEETIVAQATPKGRGGIAIVRVSGPLVCHIMRQVTARELKPREATYVVFRDTQGVALDEGVAIFFPNPHSFTGEDILELQGHGGPVVVDLLLQCVLKAGARLARPGEFSERAFLNGKLDLAQAEAIADLIDASSQQAARLAVRSLQGEFSAVIHAVLEKMIHLRMYVEAAIDFTDEEIDFLIDKKMLARMQEMLNQLQDIQKNATQGSFLREGITAVIAGAPNVGKSSLLNCLSGKELAIVTDIPGTTRDVLRDYVLIDDMPMHLIDTAGLRDSCDVVEQEGIRRAYHEIEKADIVLYLQDARHPGSEEASPFNVIKTRKRILIRNKIDLLDEPASLIENEQGWVVSLSAKTGEGIAQLRQCIKSQVGFDGSDQGLYLARRRHLEALRRATQHVESSLAQLKHAGAGELAAEDLRLAQLALNDITGEFTADDLLGRIFSSFCVGK